MSATIEVLPETNDWKDSFPQSFDEYFSNKPLEISHFDWLIHSNNTYKFPSIIQQILCIIEKASHLGQFTYFLQEELAKMVGYSEAWIRELLKRLTKIEVLKSRKVHKNMQWQINPQIKELLFDKTNKQFKSLMKQITKTTIKTLNIRNNKIKLAE